MKLVRKKALWVPSKFGWLVLTVVLVVLSSSLIFGLHPFLSHNRPIANASVMILEGWMDDAELPGVLAHADSNTLFVASGGPIEYGALLFKEKTYAEITASRLMKLGIPAERILAAPAPATQRDRTYIAAVAVRKTLKDEGLFGVPANLVSVGVHSRRSGVLYRCAFDGESPLGLISLESHRCDQRHWWRSSEAFKQVITELISWTYVQCTRWKY